MLTGRYEELYTLVIFPSWILYAMATASVIVLRKTRPDLPRPYKTIGYPVVPVLFVLVAVALILSTLVKSPRESVLGLGIIAAGLPFYWRWRRNTRRIISPQGGAPAGRTLVPTKVPQNRDSVLFSEQTT